MEALAAARLRQLLHYDPETGLFWRRFQKFSKVVGSVTNKEGHLRANVDGRASLLHRIAFLYMTGCMPEHEVDHINGDPADNRWANLRPATRSQNSRNRKLHTPTSTGMKGVSKQNDCNRWRAEIMVDGKKRYLGLFKTPGDAHAAYVDAANSYHGDFASAG